MSEKELDLDYDRVAEKLGDVVGGTGGSFVASGTITTNLLVVGPVLLTGPGGPLVTGPDISGGDPLVL